MISIVIPVFNEQESLPHLYKELIALWKEYKDYEIIFVDDGSTDNSLSLLKQISDKDKKVKIYSFRKNQGKAEALSFGFQKAKGEYVVTLDADLQDRPDEISKLLKVAQGGSDLVCGWRKNRKDSFLTNFSSKIFNKLTQFFWGLHLHDYNCGLKVLTKDVAKSLRLYGGLHRFIPLLVYQQGFSVTEIVVRHEKRRFGKSKYGLSKLWKDLPDMFTMLFLSRYSRRPLHFFWIVGNFILFLGILILLYLTIIHAQGQAIATRPLFFFGIILVLSGFQVILTGFLADLVVNASQKSTSETPLKYPNQNYKETQ